MKTEKDQGMIAGQEKKIDQALEDAERMLYFASKGKIDDKTDLDCLKELARAMVRIRNAKDRQAISEDDLAHFYSQLSIMSHILYPVTSESLKVMEGMSRHSCTDDNGKMTIWSCAKKIKSAACSSPMLMLLMTIVFVISLLVTPWIFSYSMKGSDIISRLDATIKDRVTIKKNLIEEVKRYTPESKTKNQDKNNIEDIPQPKPPGAVDSAEKKKSDSQKETLDTNKNDTRKIATLINHLEVKSAIFRSLINQLDQWNQSIPGRWIVTMDSESENRNPVNPQGGGTSENKEGNNNDIVYNDNVDTYLKAAHKYTLEVWKDPKRMDRGLKIKNTGLLILQTINGTVLLLLFGFCGAAAFIMKITIQALQAHTFTGIRCTTWLRILLGTFCGFFLGYLGGNNELLNLLTSDNEVPGGAQIKTISQVSSLTLAFIGGYSVDLLFGILNRFIYAITNDDRYLPTSEIMRRKVDVSKFIDKEKLTQDSTISKNGTASGDTGADPKPVEPKHDQQQGQDAGGKPPAE